MRGMPSSPPGTSVCVSIALRATATDELWIGRKETGINRYHCQLKLLRWLTVDFLRSWSRPFPLCLHTQHLDHEENPATEIHTISTETAPPTHTHMLCPTTRLSSQLQTHPPDPQRAASFQPIETNHRCAGQRGGDGRVPNEARGGCPWPDKALATGRWKVVFSKS